MKVSPSLYSSNLEIVKTVKLIRNTISDYIHIDCNKHIDEIISDIHIIRKNCDLPIDLHVIDSNPKSQISKLKTINPDFIAFQYENLTNDSDFFDIASEFPNVGIAITKKTKFEKVRNHIEASDYVLLMTTIPGKTGVKFNKSSLQWIKDFKTRFPYKRVHVDGGVDNEVALKLRSLGIDCIVSGSYLMKSKSMLASVLLLKGIKKEIKAKDFMINIELLPKVKLKSTIFDVYKAIEQGQRGFCFFNNENSWGILTDGDIRRYFINNRHRSINMCDISIKDMVNYNPLTIDKNKTIEEVLLKIKNKNFSRKLEFIIVTENSKPVGILTSKSILNG